MDVLLLSRLQFAATTLIKGLKDFPKDERPPVLLSFLSFRIMVALGTLFPLLALIGVILRNRLLENPWYLQLMLVVVILFLPGVLAYQAWNYFLFKSKVTKEDLVY